MLFLETDTGAVTVDWVVLTAGLVGLGIATMSVVSTGVQDTSGDIDDQLQSDDIIMSAFTFAPTAGEMSFQGETPPSNDCMMVPTLDGAPGDTVVQTCEVNQGGGVTGYNMSDGSTWQRVTQHNNGNPYTVTTTLDGTITTTGLDLDENVTTWYDGDGAVVEAPEFD